VQPAASPANEATHGANPFERYIEIVYERLMTDPELSADARHGLRSYLWQINRILSASVEENKINAE